MRGFVRGLGDQYDKSSKTNYKSLLGSEMPDWISKNRRPHQTTALDTVDSPFSLEVEVEILIEIDFFKKK